jgi:hypothetical protein
MSLSVAKNAVTKEKRQAEHIMMLCAPPAEKNAAFPSSPLRTDLFTAANASKKSRRNKKQQNNRNKAKNTERYLMPAPYFLGENDEEDYQKHNMLNNYGGAYVHRNGRHRTGKA